MNSILENKKIYALELPYKLLYCLFAFLSYMNFTFMTEIMHYMVIAVLGVAAVVAVIRLLKCKGYLRFPGFLFLCLFMISFAVSAAFSFQYGYMENIKGFVWMGLHFFTLFACDLNRPAEAYKKEFNVLSIFFIAMMALLSCGSLIMLLRGSTSLTNFDGEVITAGFLWGRLWGLFIDPNYGSVFAVIASLLSIYMFRNYKNIIARIVLSLNIFIQILYIAFSDSRTALVTAFCTIFAYTLALSIKKYKGKKIKTAAISLALSLVLAIVSCAAIVVVKPVYQKLEILTTQNSDSSSEEEDEPTIDLDGGRKENIEKDVSNRRFDIWKSGVEIFSTKPLIGVSYFNIQNYALQNLPETYLVNNDQCNFDNMHNLPLNILAAQGIFGILVFLSFMIYVLVFVFKRFFKVKDKKEYEYYTVLLACIIAGFVSSLFISDLIYVNSPTSLVFWTFLGYLLHALTKYDSKKVEK